MINAHPATVYAGNARDSTQITTDATINRTLLESSNQNWQSQEQMNFTLETSSALNSVECKQRPKEDSRLLGDSKLEQVTGERRLKSPEGQASALIAPTHRHSLTDDIDNDNENESNASFTSSTGASAGNNQTTRFRSGKQQRLSVILPGAQDKNTLVTPTIIGCETGATPSQLFKSLVQINGQDVGKFTGLPSADCLVTSSLSSINPFFWNVNSFEASGEQLIDLNGNTTRSNNSSAVNSPTVTSSQVENDAKTLGQANGKHKALPSTPQLNSSQSQSQSQSQRISNSISGPTNQQLNRNAGRELSKLSLDQIQVSNQPLTLLSPIFSLLSPEHKAWIRFNHPLANANHNNHLSQDSNPTAQLEHNQMQKYLQPTPNYDYLLNEAYQQQYQQDASDFCKAAAAAQDLSKHLVSATSTSQQMIEFSANQIESSQANERKFQANSYLGRAYNQLHQHHQQQQQSQLHNAATSNHRLPQQYNQNYRLSNPNAHMLASRGSPQQTSVQMHNHLMVAPSATYASVATSNKTDQLNASLTEPTELDERPKIPMTRPPNAHHQGANESMKVPDINNQLPLLYDANKSPIKFYESNIHNFYLAQQHAAIAQQQHPQYNYYIQHSSHRIPDQTPQLSPCSYQIPTDPNQCKLANTSNSSAKATVVGQTIENLPGLSDQNTGIVKTRDDEEIEVLPGTTQLNDCITQRSSSNDGTGRLVISKTPELFSKESSPVKVIQEHDNQAKKIRTSGKDFDKVCQVDRDNNIKSETPAKKKSKGGRKKKLVTSEELAARKNRSKERNRVAAKRCRQKRKQFLDELHGRIESLTRQNIKLQRENNLLKNELEPMRQHHKNCKI